MRYLLGLFLVLSACGKNQNTTADVTASTELTTTGMACQNVGDKIECQGLDPASPNGIPDGCSFYASGTRLFLNGQLASSDAYDCGNRFSQNLRCFYFVHNSTGPSDQVIEDVICQ